ncbi:MAG: S-layer homology domain-containing protein [Huintestinicola sp.]
MYKRIIAGITAAVLCTAIPLTFPPQVYAETTDTAAKSDSADADMKAALTLVKKVISIPKEMTDFNYSTSSYNKKNTFEFRWSDPKDGTSLNITVKGKTITRYEYNSNRSGNYQPAFAPMKKDEYVSKAFAWLEKINPEMKKQLSCSDISTQINSDRVSINFTREYKDISASNAGRGSIVLDKSTGDVIRFSCYIWWEDAKFKSPESIVSLDDIHKIYQKDVDIKPYYVFEYDWNNYNKETGKYPIKSVNIIYEPVSSIIYDAFTGKPSTMSADYIKAMNTDEYAEPAMAEDECVETEEDMDGGQGVEFTEAENAAMEELGSLLSTDEITKLLKKDKYIKLTSKYLLKSSSLEKNGDSSCGYFRNLHYQINNDKVYASIHVTVDAKTGKVFSFSRSYNDSTANEKPLLNVKTANTTAKEACIYYLGETKFNKFIASQDNSKPAANTKNYKETERSLTFCHYENNIQVKNDNIRVTVNSDNEVMSFRCTFTDVDYGDGKILSKPAAYKKLFAEQPMKLYHDGFTDLESKAHTYLCYTMDSWVLNAKTGKLCRYDGGKITTTKEIPSECPYTDIDKSPYAKEIQKLYENGVILTTDSKLDPTADISVNEMNRLMDMLFNYAVYVDYEEEAVEEDVMEEDTASNSAASSLTRRQMAAAFASRYAPNNKLLALKGIFKSPFKDVKESDEDIGSIAVAYAMGAISADSKGNFYPNAKVTREYALHVIYKYIYTINKE